jgi:hypothetical protein
MSRRSKPAELREGHATKDVDDLQQFLVRELPPGKTGQAPYFTDAIHRAGARYDRYAANKSQWLDYAPRRKRLERIARLLEESASELCKLDILSRDDLTSRLDPKEVGSHVGSARFLSREIAALAKDIQENGRPRDLAEERWILELADIYKNAFCRSANISGQGAGEANRRGDFYRLLELSRPMSFPRHGKLSPRQITRVLKLRKRHHKIEALVLLGR